METDVWIRIIDAFNKTIVISKSFRPHVVHVYKAL